MKGTDRFVSLTLLLVVCFLTMAACDGKQKNEIKSVVAEFEYACNTLDVEAILNTINPRVADKIKIALGIYGLFFNQDTSEVLESISEALIGDSELDGNDFFRSIEIEVREISLDEESAVAEAKVQYIIAGEEYKREAEFKCVYYLEEWYISSFELK